MKRRITWIIGLGLIVAIGGCATSSPESGDFAIVDSTVIDGSFAEVWESTRDVLLEQEYLIYTRDKRGIFVAYSDQKRKFLTPHRTQVTINLEPVSDGATRVTIETASQKYGVRLLTYPGWHLQESDDNSKAIAIFEGLRAHRIAESESPNTDAS